MANSNEYYLRSKAGLINRENENEPKESEELADGDPKEPSIGSGSDPEDYTIDYSRINALRSSLSRLGQRHIDLAKDNDDDRNGGIYPK